MHSLPVELRALFVWNVTLHHWVLVPNSLRGLFISSSQVKMSKKNLKDETTRLSHNTGDWLSTNGGPHPRGAETSATLPPKCKNLRTCRFHYNIPSVQAEALEMPVASGVSLAVQVSFFPGISVSIYLLQFCLVYFWASAHLENNIELIYEVDAPI